jgi:hypothetical protein
VLLVDSNEVKATWRLRLRLLWTSAGV